MCTDKIELDILLTKVKAAGAKVQIHYDDHGYYKAFQVTGLVGVDTHPMTCIVFAETMRPKFGTYFGAKRTLDQTEGVQK